MELEEVLGYDSYEMDFRHYDPAIGRFNVIDPMTEERDWLTPYNFVQNNPVLRIDPTGLLDTYGNLNSLLNNNRVAQFRRR